MRYLMLIGMCAIVLSLAASSTMGGIVTFQENDPVGGPYEWEANNWSSGVLPTTDDECRISDANCLIDGQAAECDALLLNYNGDEATVTLDSGSLAIRLLRVGWGTSGEGIFRMNGGTLAASGGTVYVGVHNATGADGVLEMTGGTFQVSILNIADRSDGNVIISGGTLSSTTIYVGDSGDIGTGQLKVIGSAASITNSGTFYVRGDYGILSFVSDAGGVSTISTNDLVVDLNSALDLSTDGNTPVGTYTLFSSILEVTQADADNFILSGTNWSNLRVTGDGPYLVQADYIPAPTSLVVLGLGGVMVLLRKRR